MYHPIEKSFKCSVYVNESKKIHREYELQAFKLLKIYQYEMDNGIEINPEFKYVIDIDDRLRDGNIISYFTCTCNLYGTLDIGNFREIPMFSTTSNPYKFADIAKTESIGRMVDQLIRRPLINYDPRLPAYIQENKDSASNIL